MMFVNSTCVTAGSNGFPCGYINPCAAKEPTLRLRAGAWLTVPWRMSLKVSPTEARRQT
jgi:hypothetical protein